MTLSFCAASIAGAGFRQTGFHMSITVIRSVIAAVLAAMFPQIGRAHV